MNCNKIGVKGKQCTQLSVLDRNFDGFEAASQFCLFFNNLFDSFNAYPGEVGPAIRKPVNKNSWLHMEIWDSAITVFKTMYFLLPVSVTGKRTTYCCRI